MSELEEAAVALEEMALEGIDEADMLEHEFERAMKSLQRLGPMPTLIYLTGLDVAQVKSRKVLLGKEEREWRMVELEHWNLTKQLADEYLLRFNDARESAKLAVQEAKDARTVWHSAYDARVHALQLAAAVSAERVASKEAQLEHVRAHLEFAERKATRERLLQDAQCVWGPDHATHRPPGRPWTDGVTGTMTCVMGP